jgi:hypothetical protein
MERSRSQSSRLARPGLVAVAITFLLSIGFALVPARRALAQAGNTHIVVSEVLYDLDGTSQSRTYIEFANLGPQDWDPHNHWIYRWAAREDGTIEDQVMIQIAGDGAKDLKPIPPGGVLLVEWGRPDTKANFPAATGANVFATGRPTDIPIQDDDLQDRIAIALFAPQGSAPVTPDTDLTFGGATMLAYYLQGNINENNGTTNTLGDAIGAHRAIDLGLWDDYEGAPSGHDWANVLRWPAPAAGQPIASQIGRRRKDYYLSHYGLPSLSNADRGASTAGAVNPRQGTPGQPNYQFPGELIPGQSSANGNSLQLLRVTATAASGSPAGSIQIAATDTSGAIATNLLSGDTWSGWQIVGGPVLGKPVFADNIKTSSRLLVAVDAITGQLYANRFAASGSNPPAFQGWQAVGGKATGTPAVATDAGTGVEILVFNDATGQTMVLASQKGKFGPSQALPGNPKLTDLAAVFSTSGLAILGFDGGQLRRSIGDPSGAFGDLANVGSAFNNRGPYIATVARYNSVSDQIEVLVTGESGALQLGHLKLGSGGAADTFSGWLPVGITTDSAPGMAVNSDTGDLLVIARGADLPIPQGERLNPTAGQALVAMFRNASGKFDPVTRVDRGLMPRGASPDVVYDDKAKQFQQFVVGDDNQVYRVTTK